MTSPHKVPISNDITSLPIPIAFKYNNPFICKVAQIIVTLLLKQLFALGSVNIDQYLLSAVSSQYGPRACLKRLKY